MNSIFILLVIATISSTVDASIDPHCYETLEIIQFRWSIENFKSRNFANSEAIVSPMFPPESSSDSQWFLQYYSKYLYLCSHSTIRGRELATYSTYPLPSTFDEDGIHKNTKFTKPDYIPHPDKGICKRGNTFFVSPMEASKFVTKSGSLEFLTIVTRLRKLPVCLKTGEEDLGRGTISEPLDPPITRAYHCTSDSTILEDIHYTWEGKLPNNPQDGFEMTSPLFPTNDPNRQWEMVLKKEPSSDVMGLFFKYVSTLTVTAIISIRPADYFDTFPVHTFSEKTKTIGYINYSSFKYIRTHLFSTDGTFKIPIHVAIVRDEHTCKQVCPLIGLKAPYQPEAKKPEKILEELKIKNQELQTEKTELENANTGLLNGNADLRTKNSGITNENTKLEDLNTDLQDEINELKGANTPPQNSDAVLKKSNKDFEDSNSWYVRANAELETGNKVLRNKNSELVSSKEDAEIKHKKCKAGLESARELAEKVEATLRSFQH